MRAIPKNSAITGGWVQGVRCVASPNCDLRPVGMVPELLVMHSISLPPGCFGGDEIEQFFTNSLDCTAHEFFGQLVGLRVSAHFLIRRDGEVVQFVPIDRRAWHAGVSSWNGRKRCNDFSVGIELEGTDQTPYTDRQYASLLTLSDQLLRRYASLSVDAIVGHSDIAPGRKTDPGPAFDWSRFLRALAECRSAG